MRGRRFFALLLLCLFLFSACSSVSVKLRYEDGLYRDRTGAHSYRLLPSTYTAEKAGEPYAEADGYVLCRIKGHDSIDYLIEENHAFVYADASLSVPDAEDYGDSTVYIGLSEHLPTAFWKITDAETANAILDCYLYGTETYPVGTEEECYQVLFQNDRYPHLLFRLYLVKTETSYYLYDFESKQYKDPPESLLARLLNGEE